MNELDHLISKRLMGRATYQDLNRIKFLLKRADRLRILVFLMRIALGFFVISLITGYALYLFDAELFSL